MFMKKTTEKTKIGSLILCCLLIGHFAISQQMPQYTQYILNSYVINPAIAGSKDYFEGKINHREQWLGITDAPRTNIISAYGPLMDNMGVGGYLFSDINGPTRQLGLSLSYAYHIKLNEEMKLSMALYGSILQFSIDGSKISTANINDPVLSNGLQSGIIPDAGFSSYFYTEKYFAGVSFAQLTNTRIKYKQITATTDGTLTGHYFLMGGYNFNINDDLLLQPSVLVKYVNPVPVQAEFTARAVYKDMIQAAISYRSSDALGMILGYTHQNYLSIAYSYDFLVSGLQDYSTGSHEVMLGIRFKDKTEDK